MKALEEMCLTRHTGWVFQLLVFLRMENHRNYNITSQCKELAGMIPCLTIHFLRNWKKNEPRLLSAVEIGADIKKLPMLRMELVSSGTGQYLGDKPNKPPGNTVVLSISKHESPRDTCLLFVYSLFTNCLQLFTIVY